uniref:Uncharacterized protein n=2 Tax=Zea mays TaxID=4577 RepID=A0A804MVJ8_MAIZE
MVSFVTTNGEPTTMATSKLVWWNLGEQMMMTPTSCTSAATLPTRRRAPPSRALYKSGSIIVLGKTDFLRPDMDLVPRWTAIKRRHMTLSPCSNEPQHAVGMTVPGIILRRHSHASAAGAASSID